MEDRHAVVRRAGLTMLGTIIGAGIFALPSTFDRVGFWPATILFAVLTLIVLSTHLMAVDMVLSSPQRMRLGGFASRELGAVGHWIAAWTWPLQIVGVNVIHILLGGEFLFLLARMVGVDLPVVGWQMVFWLAGATIVFYGLKVVGKAEALATWLLIGSVVVASLLALDQFHPWKAAIADWSAALLPFGIFLFALSGLSVVPEVVELAGRNRSLSRRAVIVGTVAAAALSWIFTVALSFAVEGTVGRSPADLMRALPASAAWLIPVVGFLAVATSYITTAQDLKATLHLDFRAPRLLAWLAALFTPIALVLTLRRDYLFVIDVVGTAFAGINGLLVALIAMRIYARTGIGDRGSRIGNWGWRVAIPAGVAAAYVFGILYKLLA